MLERNLQVVLIGCAIVFAPSMKGAPPEAIRLQGTILQIAGQPPQDTSYSFEVDFFGSAVGGVSLLPTQTPITASAQVVGGAYSLVVSPGNPGDLIAALATPPVFAEVRVVGGPGVQGSELLHPRQEIASVPYALSSPVPPAAPAVAVQRVEKTDTQSIASTAWTTILDDGNTANLSVSVAPPTSDYKITITAKPFLKQFGAPQYSYVRLVEDCGSGVVSVDEAVNWTFYNQVFLVPTLRFVRESPTPGVTCTYSLEAAAYGSQTTGSVEVNGGQTSGPTLRPNTWIESRMELAD